MKRIFFMTLFVALTTITYGQTDDKGYEEGKWVLKGVTGLNLVANGDVELVGWR